MHYRSIPKEKGQLHENRTVFNTTVTLTANPAEGWQFIEWRGNLSGSNNPVQITVDEAKEVTAVFEKKSYELTTNTEGNGAVSEEIMQTNAISEYEHDTIVELTATPAEGWRFVEWQGDLSGSENPKQIVIDEPKEVTAVFERQTYALTVNTDGEGTVTKEPDQTEYAFNSTVMLTANPAKGWQFVEWQGDLSGNENSEQIAIDEPKEVTAVFEKKTFKLTVNTDGEGDVAWEPNKLNFEYNSTVTLTATPAEEWQFVEWTGDYKGTQATIELVMSEDKSIKANFERTKGYKLDVTVEGNGRVEEKVLRKTENETVVELTAIPDEGSVFREWKGYLSGDKNPEKIRMKGVEKNVTAVFKKNGYQLNLSIDGEGEISTGLIEGRRQGDGYAPGSLIEINVIPKRDWVFAGWQGDISLRELPVRIRMNQDIEATATTQYAENFFSAGDGTLDNPLIITTLDQLQATAYHRNPFGHTAYALANDIDASSTADWNEGRGFDPIDFSAEYFLGRGYTISNITINRPHKNKVGLFSQIAYQTFGTIQNLTVKDINVTGGKYTGGLVGFAYVSTRFLVDNVNLSGNIKGNDYYTAGLVGYNSDKGDPDRIMNSHTDVNVEGIRFSGGLIGASAAIIENSSSQGTVTSENISGGLVGVNSSEIISSYSSADVNGKFEIGGLVGENRGDITTSYSDGMILGSNNVGGLVGVNNNSIANSYALGVVEGDLNIGGLVGLADFRSTIDRSFAGVDLIGTASVGGLVGGYSGSCAEDHTFENSYWDTEVSEINTATGSGSCGDITGLNTSEMTGSEAENNMPEFDFVEIWMTTDSYPVIRGLEEQ